MSESLCEIKTESLLEAEDNESVRTPTSDENSTGASLSTDPEAEKSPPPQSNKRRKRRRKRMLTGVSRQRRAANARERRRVQGVNRAFVELKNSLPVSHMDISKIDILRVATKWIDHLAHLLSEDDAATRLEEEVHDSVSGFSLVDSEPYGSLGSDHFSPSDDDLLDQPFMSVDDLWLPPSSFCENGLLSNVFGSSGLVNDGGYCVHIDEPYLQTIFFDNSCNTGYSHFIGSPFLDFEDL